MHRPPRPTFKSTQVFPAQIRKIFTPDFFCQELDSPNNQPVIVSMRQNDEPKTVTHKSYQDTQNIQCIEISKQKKIGIQPPKNSSLHGRSFKIRNYTNYRIKENTIPFKQSQKKMAFIKQQKQDKNILHTNLNNDNIENSANKQKSRVINLHSYPQSLDIAQLGTKIKCVSLGQSQLQQQMYSETITESDSKTIQMQSDRQWILIINQNLLQGQLTNISVMNKFNSICLHLKKNHPNILIALKIEKERDLQTIRKLCKKTKINLDYLIAIKDKHIERVYGIDLNETKIKNLRRIVVLQDHLDFSHTYYYISNNQFSEKQINSFQKIAYIKINGIQSLLKISQQMRINQFDDQIIVTGCIYRDDTHNYMMREQVYNKIKIMMNRRKIKRKRSKSYRSSSIKQLSKDMIVQNQTKSITDKNQEFKRKMIQYVKILQEDCRNQAKKQTHIPHMPEKKQINFFERNGALKLITTPVQQKSQTNLGYYGNNISNSKTPYQIVYELLKNNSLIFKQIFKYQNDIEGIQLPVHYEIL